MTINTKIYFPNLNGLRFIAAFMVIIHHLEQILTFFGLENYWDNPIILIIGGLGLELFFVLSGFLISYLLFTEEKNTSTISIKDFYIRRVLRIWPLYYFIGILAFFILPQFNLFDIPYISKHLTENFSLSLLLFVFFLPNLLLYGYGIIVPYASQSWSVGVEEQFYIIWPFLLKYFKNKLLTLFLVIFIYLFIQSIVFPFLKHFIFWNQELEMFRQVWTNFHIQCMAIGGVFAWIYFTKHKYLKFLCNNLVYITTLLLTFIVIIFSINLPFLNNEVHALLFGIIILNLVSSKTKGLFLENSIFNFLGKISYGIYMYHIIAIVLCIKLFWYFNILEYHLLLAVSSLSLTIILASVSYQFIEKRFISLKSKYTNVIIGENAK